MFYSSTENNVEVEDRRPIYALGLGKMSLDLKIESLEELVAEMQCSSCKAVPQPSNSARYKCVIMGHTLCKNCKEASAGGYIKKCRLCGRDHNSHITEIECGMTKVLLKNLPWFCRFYKNGCREAFLNERALAGHQLECVYHNIKCSNRLCSKEILFKDYLDHFSECFSSIPPFKSTKVKVEYKVPDVRDRTWNPARIEAHGFSFFFNFITRNGLCQMWMVMLTCSPDVLKNFEWSLSIDGADNEGFTFRGKMIPIDKDPEEIHGDREGFLLGCKKAMDFQNRAGGNLEVMIQIGNLKEEAKDDDVESGVSSDTEPVLFNFSKPHCLMNTT